MQAFFVFVLVVFLFDLYVFKALRKIIRSLSSKRTKWLFYILFWSLTLLLVVLTLFTYLKQVGPPAYFSSYYSLVGLYVLVYTPKLLIAIFHLVDDVKYLFRYLILKVRFRKTERLVSKSWFFTKSGFFLSILPFIAILYGILYGRFDFRTSEHTIEFEHLPAAFDNFRIVQISDIHTGSFYANKKQLKKALGLIQETNADLVVFTGDLINNFAGELSDWNTYFKQIHARHGKFAVLGNHDYGNYSLWKTPQEKQENFQAIKDFFQATGFRLLNNENEMLVLDSDSIAIIGVENWGVPPFPQYGDLNAALEGIQNVPFKILLSHDPSHWDAEVKGTSDIALTLSGHTHALQFGLTLGNRSWSPAKYIFPQWAGLYKHNNQYLYVNRGLGFIGFPGRIGMPPEITVITLQKVSGK